MLSPLLAFLLALAALLLAPDRAGAQGTRTGEGGIAPGPVLVELFTSQGCSACPPADRVLASLKGRPGLLVLSFHVSYWDHMGWPDPFAIPASVRRQRGYARAMRSRSIYTPQIIVQGAAAAIGSDAGRIARLIEEAAPAVALAVALDGHRGERLSVSVPEVRDVPLPLELWAVLYLDSAQSFVPNGENAGHRLHHVNVVRHAAVAAMLEVTPALVLLDRPEGVAADGVAIILQGRNLGPVIGTGRLALR